MLVAVDLPKYHPERPQIAQVLERKGEQIEVLWYHGTWTTTWCIFRKRQGRNMVDVKETISVSSVKLFNFKFTSSGKLKQSVKKDLRNIYFRDDSNNESSD